MDLKIEIVKTINTLIKCNSFREYIATIVHSMINLIEVYQTYTMKEANPLNQAIINLFCRMAQELKIDFAPFIELIQESLNRHKKISEEFDIQVEGITKLNLIDLFKNNLKKLDSDEQNEGAADTEHQPSISQFDDPFNQQSNLYVRSTNPALHMTLEREIEQRRL